MNRLKHELQKWMGEEPKFQHHHEQKVLNQLQHTKSEKRDKNYWSYRVTTVTFVAAILLFIAVGFWQPTNKNLSKDEAFEAYIKANFDDDRLLYQETELLHKNDALVVSKNQDGVFVLGYLEYENNQWFYKGSCDIQNSENESTIHFSKSVSEPFLYCGVIQGDDVKDVIVGQKTSTVVEVENNLKLWFAFGNNMGERVVFQFADGSMQRMNEIDWLETETQLYDLAVVSHTSNNQISWSYSGNGMNRGNYEYEQFPLILEQASQPEQLTRGDVVYFTKKERSMNMEELDKQNPVYASQRELARIVALPGESIEIRNGTVIVNKVPLDIFYGFATINGEAVFENYVEYLKQQDTMNISVETVREIFFRNMDERVLGPDEYFVIGDNWGSGTMQLLQSSDIEGKVLGYELEALKEEWTAQEIALYEEFRNKNDSTVFQGVNPITIARVQLLAQFLADQRTMYRLYTTRPEYVQWSESTHMREHTMLEAETERFAAYQLARQLAKGTFQLLESGYEGVIIFNDEKSSSELAWRMIKNEQGIWQVAFLPIQ